MSRSKFTSVLSASGISLFFLFLFTPTLYELFLGPSSVPFIGEYPGVFLCCVSLGIYPFSGFLYFFSERNSNDHELGFVVGGAISSGVVFLYFLGTSLLVTPGGLSEALRLAYLGIQEFYPNQATIAFGSLMGLGAALLMFAATGAISALFASLLLKSREKI